MGVVFALTLATSMAVRKPKTWGDAHRSVIVSSSRNLGHNLIPLYSGRFNGRKYSPCQLLLLQSWGRPFTLPSPSPLHQFVHLMACGVAQRTQNGMILAFPSVLVLSFELNLMPTGSVCSVRLEFHSFSQFLFFISPYNPSFALERLICIFFGHDPSALPVFLERVPLLKGRTATSPYGMRS